ncbi:MAG: helicase-related protein, partial [Acholeplasmataceae bacterium]|nr:helicase-related protein [Acholeplasmataceae bacterium]
RCHGCNYKKAYSEICSNCNQPKNKEIGYGIEQAYEVLKNTFKSARIVVLESSRITKRGSYEKILNDFKDGKIDVLLGTQILSKAFNFENVSLVAILLADQMLKIRSYLANEKTYQLYSQTIGSLRGKIKTKALIQTYDKKHFVLNALKNEDNIMFYEEELKLRKRLNYPPFSKMAKLTLRGTDEINTFQRLHSIKHHLIKSNTQLEIIGPSEDYFKFKDNYYYFEIIIKAPLRYDIMALLKYLNEKHHKDNILINLYDDSL